MKKGLILILAIAIGAAVWSGMANQVKGETVCFVWNTEAGDYAALQLSIYENNEAKGSLDLAIFEKDRKTGDVEGEIDGEIAHLRWRGVAEGVSINEELIIKLDENTAKPGFGEMLEQEGVSKYMNPNILTYPITLQKIDCTDEALEYKPRIVEAEELEPIVSFTPNNPIQGEPVLVTIENLSTTSVRSITFQSKALGVFDDSALIGLDLRMAPGTYPLVATLSNGEVIKKNLTVGKRTVVQAPLGIPDSLGGDTPEAEKELLNTLTQEGALINAIPTSSSKLWSGNFRLPIDPPITITDTYGYSRLTGASTIAHKGTDYRATIGTPVYAMNSGTIRFKRFLRNYGNVVGIDHGLGLLTIYMHLSEILVNEGENVEKGKLIAKSGNTGYVLGPHLHLTIRINQISIDPEKFMALLGEK